MAIDPYHRYSNEPTKTVMMISNSKKHFGLNGLHIISALWRLMAAPFYSRKKKDFLYFFCFFFASLLLWDVVKLYIEKLLTSC